MNVKALDAIKEINSMFKDNSLVLKLGDTKSIDIERVPINKISLDYVLGGGVPIGRIIEIFGGESSGKTTIALHILERFQKEFKDKSCAFIDFEHAFDPEYAKKIGVDVENLVFSQPMYAEQGLETVSKLISSEGYSLIVVDSVAAMSPESEIKGEIGKSSIGVHARLMSQTMRKITGLANKTGTTVIFINQIREKIGVSYGNPEVTTGGNALKFYSSIRIQVYRGAKRDSSGEVVGNRGKVKAVKNKTFPPYKESEFDINFGEGINEISDIVDHAILLGIVEKKGSWYKLLDKSLGQGKENVETFLSENAKVKEEIKNIIYKKYFG